MNVDGLRSIDDHHHFPGAPLSPGTLGAQSRIASPEWGAVWQGRTDPAPFDADALEISALYSLVSGESDFRTTPDRIAWVLESQAIKLGWPRGHILGSEASLSLAFGAGRETVREAVRMVERRGSMRMVKGRTGGLQIAGPSMAHTLRALQLYLQSTGCTIKQAREARHAIAVLPVAIDHDMHELIDGLIDLMLPGNNADQALCDVNGSEDNFFACLEGRAHAIALQIAGSWAIGPQTNPARFGSEWELCEQYNVSQRVLRQALRILADHDLLEGRRGRGGGIFLKSPSPAGVLRQVLPYLSSMPCDLDCLIAMLWEFNFRALRQAASVLREKSRDEVIKWHQATMTTLASVKQPERAALLQAQISSLENNPIIDIFARITVAYCTRWYPLDGAILEKSAPIMADLEIAILDALMTGELAKAEDTMAAARTLTKGFFVT